MDWLTVLIAYTIIGFLVPFGLAFYAGYSKIEPAKESDLRFIIFVGGPFWWIVYGALQLTEFCYSLGERLN